MAAGKDEGGRIKNWGERARLRYPRARSSFLDGEENRMVDRRAARAHASPEYLSSSPNGGKFDPVENCPALAHSLSPALSFLRSGRKWRSFARSPARSLCRSRFGEFHGGALFKSENAEWGRTKEERKEGNGRKAKRKPLLSLLSLSLSLSLSLFACVHPCTHRFPSLTTSDDDEN